MHIHGKTDGAYNYLLMQGKTDDAYNCLPMHGKTLSAYRPNKGTLKLHLYYKLGNIWSAPGAKQSFF